MTIRSAIFVSLCALGATACSNASPPSETVGAAAAAVRTSKCHPSGNGTTHVRAVVTIEEYDGLSYGRNGTHEHALARITDLEAADDASVVDSDEVSLAMNVASDRDPAGLPSEIPLSPGDTIELEGIYISSTASYDGQPVIHFCHSPCGWVTIGGQTY